jgi:hypothetical protein
MSIEFKAKNGFLPSKYIQNNTLYPIKQIAGIIEFLVAVYP